MSRRDWGPDDERKHPRDPRTGEFIDAGSLVQRLSDEIGARHAVASPPEPRPDLAPGPSDLDGAGSVAAILHAGFPKAAKKRKALADQLYSYLARVTAYADPGSGLRARLRVNKGISLQPGDIVRMEFDVVNSDGAVVGKSLQEMIPANNGKGMRILHDNFEITDRDARGGGFGTRWNRHMEDVYRANGGTEIKLEANLDVGGYAWAKQGYHFSEFAGIDRLRGDMTEARLQGKVVTDRGTVDIPPALAREFEALENRMQWGNWDDGTVPTPLEIAMLGWTEGAQMWPGKLLMLRSLWTGVKKL